MQIIYRTFACRALTAGLMTALMTTAYAADERRSLEAFQALQVKGAVYVTLVQGPGHHADIEASDSALERLVTEVNDGVLTISQEDGWFSWWGNEDVRITLNFEDLNQIVLSGSGDIVSDELALEDVEITLRGSGDIEIEQLFAETANVRLLGSGDIRINALEAEDVATELRGSGDVRLNGRATTLAASVFGSGDVHAQGLSSQQASAVINGSGNIRVLADVSLDATVRGSGDVRYAGDAEVQDSVYGSGTVSRM